MKSKAKKKSVKRDLKWRRVAGDRGIQKSGVKVNGKYKYRLRFTKVVMGNDGKPVLTEKGFPKREYRHEVFDSKDAALNAKAAAETKFRNGYEMPSVDPTKVTFADLEKAFAPRLHEVRYDNPPNPDDRHKVSGTKGWKNEVRDMKTFAEYFGSKLISTITSDDIEDLRDVRLATPKLRGGGKRSRANVNRELATLSKAFSFAMRKKWLTLNPVHSGKRIINPKQEAKRERVLTFPEQTRLLDATVTLGYDYLRMLLLFLLHTATRLGDAQELERRDIDLNEGALGLITIRRLTTKTDELRKIPILHPELREVIDQRLAAIEPDDPHALLFGKPYSSFRKQFAKAKTLAKVKDFQLRDTRHTWITRAAPSGIDPVAAMAISGHKKLSTFMIYNNALTEMNDANAKKYQAYIAVNAVQESMTSEQIN
jgi:integrase